MVFRIPRRGAYTGRLAFDPGSQFHVDPKGRKVVTEDAGKSWRYARVGDTSHNARYEKRVAAIDTTANAPDPEPHHWEPQPHDNHYDTGAPNKTNLISSPDHVAAKETSHTDAYKETQ